MRATLIALVITVGILLALSLRGGAQTLYDLPPATSLTSGPVVAELFTSQSCSSCPPAEKLFAELANRPDLIVLEWHVDYWDKLIHGRAGSWKDPFSDAAHTARQRRYNRTLRRSGQVYTPQAVINGTGETVGSRRSDVERLLKSEQHAQAPIEIAPAAGQLAVEIGPLAINSELNAEIYRLTLLPEQRTAVRSGENRGVRLFSRNIVLAAEAVGTYSGDAQTLTIDAPKAGETCAVIVQETVRNRLGPILGASYCY